MNSGWADPKHTPSRRVIASLIGYEPGSPGTRAPTSTTSLTAGVLSQPPVLDLQVSSSSPAYAQTPGEVLWKSSRAARSRTFLSASGWPSVSASKASALPSGWMRRQRKVAASCAQ
jgi:hypothetical protein